MIAISPVQLAEHMFYFLRPVASATTCTSSQLQLQSVAFAPCCTDGRGQYQQYETG